MVSTTDILRDIPPDKIDQTCTDPSTGGLDQSQNYEKPSEVFGKVNEVNILEDTFGNLTIKSSTSVELAKKKFGCNFANCDIQKGDSVIKCGECSSRVHYKCSRLPGYQLHRFLTARNYRKYVCEQCCGSIPSDIYENELDRGGIGNNSYTKQGISFNVENMKKLLDEKNHEIGRQEALLISLKETHDTDMDLLKDKDNIISKQNQMMTSLRLSFKGSSDSEISHTDSLSQLQEKDNVINEQVEKIERLKTVINEIAERDKMNIDKEEELLEMHLQLKLSKQNNKTFIEKCEEQALLLRKSEQAFEAKSELVEAKNEIIGNLKSLINQSGEEIEKLDFVESGMSVESENGKVKGKGIEECCEYLKVHGTKGVILNAVLLWMNIERQMSPENVWKSTAVAKFLKDEIADAKETLWRICGDSIPLKLTKRQGQTKSVSEVNDICKALNALSEKECLPMFISTSDMVKTTPICEPVEIHSDNQDVTKILKGIEKSITSLADQENERHIELKLAIERNVLDNVHQDLTHVKLLPQGNQTVDNESERTQVFPRDATVHFDDDEEGWNKVQEKSNKNIKHQTWRQRLNILRGTGANETGDSLSADINLVAYGVRKDVSGIQLSAWLKARGLNVKSCDLLTTFSGSRSLAYKVTVGKNDYEKATDPDIWPEGVGVRKYKLFTQRNSNLNQNKQRTNEGLTNSVNGPPIKPISRQSNMYRHQFQGNSALLPHDDVNLRQQLNVQSRNAQNVNFIQHDIPLNNYQNTIPQSPKRNVLQLGNMRYNQINTFPNMNSVQQGFREENWNPSLANSFVGQQNHKYIFV